MPLAGAIDGTARAIIAPSTTDSLFVDGNYYSHKGYHAINVLAVRKTSVWSCISCLLKILIRCFVQHVGKK